jgi:hypothetical protein
MRLPRYSVRAAKSSPVWQQRCLLPDLFISMRRFTTASPWASRNIWSRRLAIISRQILSGILAIEMDRASIVKTP